MGSPAAPWLAECAGKTSIGHPGAKAPFNGGAGVDADDFWHFSIDRYARPGVAEACLRLQDRDGLDVNLVLFSLWCGATGRSLDTETLRGAVAACRPWRQTVLLKLRALRRALKPGVANVPAERAAALRERIKGLELEAERVQQEILVRLAPAATQAPSPILATRNFEDYLRAAARPSAGDEWQAIVAASFG